MASDEAQARYPMILPEDWEELGYVTLSQERLFVHLDGRIHDLFKYTVDGKPMKTWVKQTPRQYQVIRAVLEPVFQLATNILLSPASLDWFYYLIFSSRTLTDPPIQHNGDDVYVYRHDDTPMVTRHQKAKAALQRLAMVHTIELEDLDGDDHDDEGRTEPRTDRLEQGVNIKDDSPRISGIGPRVTMSRAFLRDFLRMCMEGSQSLEELHVMVTKMALAFIHELAHAAVMATSIRRYESVKRELSMRADAAAKNVQRIPKADNVNEDLFEDENAAEAGYSWENYVFGGIIELLDLNSANPLLVIEWPNFLKGDQDLRKGGWKPSATQYIVPRQFILNVNSQEWWNKVKKNDTTALYIKKIIGIRVDCPNPDTIDSDIDSSDTSESKWPDDKKRSRGTVKSRRVSRKRPGVNIQDPSRAGASEWAT